MKMSLLVLISYGKTTGGEMDKIWQIGLKLNGIFYRRNFSDPNTESVFTKYDTTRTIL